MDIKTDYYSVIKVNNKFAHEGAKNKQVMNTARFSQGEDIYDPSFKATKLNRQIFAQLFGALDVSYNRMNQLFTTFKSSIRKYGSYKPYY